MYYGYPKKISEISGHEVSKERMCVIFLKNVTRSLKARIMKISNFRETGEIGKYIGVPLSENFLEETITVWRN